jgi:hypothetical protein
MEVAFPSNAFVRGEPDQSEIVRMPPRGPACGGNRQNDDAQREHRKSHEFENQRVHSQSPQANQQIGWEAIDRLLIFGAWVAPARPMFDQRLMIYVPQKV